MSDRSETYAEILARMIKQETVSEQDTVGGDKFAAFRELLRELFPRLFGACEVRTFHDSLLLLWQGRDRGQEPVLFLNHMDVVEATGEWSRPPFSGDISDGKLWGRGALDDKGGLWAMLQAAEELAGEGFAPTRDIYFMSSCTEETAGRGAEEIAAWFEENDIRLAMSFDEGGMILHDPIGGADGDFAMIGVGEKGCADLRFVARSSGGHASTPGKDTPLVRLGKFMAAADKGGLFTKELSDTTCEMLRRFAPYMGKVGLITGRPRLFAPLLKRVLPKLSGAAGALVRTTLAFTMAQGSGGCNVLPEEAWVVGNMRCSHHQGREGSIRAVTELARKYDIEVEVLDPGCESRLTDYNGPAFRLAERAVAAIFPGVAPVPYVMTGASDSRFLDRVCDQCVRFLPYKIDDQQLASVHGLDENVDIASLSPAVDYYKYLMQEV